MRKIVFGLFAALSAYGWNEAAAAPGEAPAAAKYCQFDFTRQHDETGEAFEARMREKCRVGDIVLLDTPDDVARFCDLSKTVVTRGAGDIGYVCHLSSKREVY